MEANDWRPDHDSYKSDVFCLGLTILAAASLENVKSVFNFHKLVIYDDLIRDWVEGLRERYSSGFVRFLQDMLILNEEKRPDFNKLRQNLEGINVNSMKVHIYNVICRNFLSFFFFFFFLNLFRRKFFHG